MNKQFFRSIFFLLANLSLASILALTPLYFAVFLRTDSVFELNKLVLFKILLSVFFVSVIGGIFFSDKPKQYKAIMKKPIFFLPLLYLAFYLLSACFSVNSGISFSGLSDRLEGFYSIFYYILFFYLVYFHLQDERIKVDFYLKFIAGSSLAVGLYGFVQWLGHDPLSWMETYSETLRITSTFGQPNNLAAYFLLVYPIIVYLALGSHSKIGQIAYYLLTLLCFLGLYLTNSLGAWLALAFSLVFLSALVIWNSKPNIFFKIKILNKRSFVFLFLSALTIIFIFGLFFDYSDNWVAKNKFKTFISGNNPSVVNRIWFWEAGWDAFTKKPILGYGPETQPDIMAAYYKKEWANINQVNVVPSRTHSIIIDQLLAVGLLGTAAYALVWISFISIAVALVKRKDGNSRLAMSILLGLLGYLMWLLFNYSMVVGWVYFFFFGAVAASLYFPVKTEPIPGREYFFGRFMKIFIWLVLLVAVSYNIRWQLNTLIIDHYFQAFKESRLKNDYLTALELNMYINELRPEQGYYQREMGIILSYWLDDIDEDLYEKPALKIIENYLNSADSETFSDSLAAAEMMAPLIVAGKEEYIKIAEEKYLKLIATSPEMPLLYFGFGRYYLASGEADQALGAFTKALTLLPEKDGPLINREQVRRINLTEAKYSIGLADAYDLKGDYDKALFYYGSAAKVVGRGSILTNKMMITNINKGDLDSAIELAKYGNQIEPSNYYWLHRLAVLMKDEGRYDEAIVYADQALELIPGNELLKGLLSDLKELNNNGKSNN